MVPPPANELTPSGGQRLFVLIADDNRDLARTLSILLSFWGIDVQTVSDGREVLQAALARRPDALLLDVALPGMDGFQVAEQLRANPNFRNMMIIGISAYDCMQLDGRPQQAGFDHHLVKPFHYENVLELLAPLR
jgi:two-component system CheB/CheR fusion protein